jgi:hypothetical protein
MPVNFERADYKLAKRRYDLITHCLEGSTRIKEKRELYLPRPNAEDKSRENIARYNAYLTRAVFYNVTGRTMRGLQGQVFLRDPLIEVPPSLDKVVENATGLGVSLLQLAKEGVNHTVAYGRGGIFTDFPSVAAGGASVAQVASGEIRPNINVYNPVDIINWRTTTIDNKEQLSLVVLRETYEYPVDDYQMTLKILYRALILTPDGYEVRVYKDLAIRPEIYYPTKPDGSRWREIPFSFVGSVNNDPKIDYPPLYDLAELNVAHYRNSADYEEACFMVGQPTPVFAGLSKDWVETVLKGRVELGSRAAIALPAGATAQLLQAEANTMPSDAMAHKERQMVALGAKLVENRSVQRTATEASQEATSEQSTLASSAANVGAAITQALRWAAEFINEPTDDITFKLNTEFDLVKMSPEERKAVIGEWVAGAITFTEMRENLRRGGIATLDDAAARKEIDADSGAPIVIANDPIENDDGNEDG